MGNFNQEMVRLGFIYLTLYAGVLKKKKEFFLYPTELTGRDNMALQTPNECKEHNECVKYFNRMFAA